MSEFRKTLFVRLVVVFAISGVALTQEKAPGVGTATQVVVLGTGNPSADPERWGPAVAIVVNGRAYLVDCGPGWCGGLRRRKRMGLRR